jgi:NAD(P)-dependent dehydrogenase (short-subunit alcohol dehydrogenase family)
VVVASAGNKQTDKLSYPAAFPGVIAVAAVNSPRIIASSLSHASQVVDGSADHLIGGLETPDGVEQVAYTVSRAGLAALSAAMARELSPHGVRVYAIEVNRDTAAAATEVLRAVESWR